MKSTRKVYEFLLTQFEPVNFEAVSDALGMDGREARSTLHNLCKNEKVKLEEVKYVGSRQVKKFNTYWLAVRKPSSEIFEKKNHTIVLKILNRHTESLSYEELSDLAEGQLSLSQVRSAVGEIVKMDSDKIIKSKAGVVVKIRTANPTNAIKDGEVSKSNMSLVNLLFTGRTSEAVNKLHSTQC